MTGSTKQLDCLIYAANMGLGIEFSATPLMQKIGLHQATAYHALWKLVDKKYLDVRVGEDECGGKKYFSLTRSGQRYLMEIQSRLNAIAYLHDE